MGKETKGWKKVAKIMNHIYLDELLLLFSHDLFRINFE